MKKMSHSLTLNCFHNETDLSRFSLQSPINDIIIFKIYELFTRPGQTIYKAQNVHSDYKAHTFLLVLIHI